MIAFANSIAQFAIQIKNGVMKRANVSEQIFVHAKKDYSWNPSTCICKNGRHLKSVADDSKICVMKLYMLRILYQQMWQMIYQEMCQQTLIVKK